MFPPYTILHVLWQKNYLFYFLSTTTMHMRGITSCTAKTNLLLESIKDYLSTPNRKRGNSLRLYSTLNSFENTLSPNCEQGVNLTSHHFDAHLITLGNWT